MKSRTLLGFLAMAFFTSAPVLFASGCSDDENISDEQGALCSTEGAYACDSNVLMRCTDGKMETIEDCGQDECHADEGHCHEDDHDHDHGHDEHHDHGHDEHHDHGHDEHHDHGHDEHHDHG